jgi:hypothetical protein
MSLNAASDFLEGTDALRFSIDHARNVIAEDRAKDPANLARLQGKYDIFKLLDHRASYEPTQFAAHAGAIGQFVRDDRKIIAGP